ncbi:GntR family transcriptional regulator [Modestobacter sp. I12A-02662]|uniref:GntR family transcriptional regulator n=1 Tax=Modestobacter sp. I12A-02662 TaxID=1730496 RepID=UPI0034E00FCC
MATPMFRAALTKAEYAYSEVRERIMSGELPHGATISQEALAAELNVSTTPLREAMRRLSSEGLVVLDAHRDARVAPLTADEARSLFEVRQQLDPLAVRLAAGRRDSADMARIRDAAASLEPLDAGSGLIALEAHRAFHAALYRASHNDLLIGLLDGLWDKADRYRRAALESRDDSPDDRARVRAEHQAMMAAVLDGDPEEAEEQMRRHVANSLGRRAVAILGGN